MQRSINHLIGSGMEATDGAIGKVEDFYFEDDTWAIRYLVVKTGNWLSGRKVLISPAALTKAAWESGIFPVNLTGQQIRNSPDIDTEKPVSRQQEIALHAYYPWQNYWETGFYPGGVWGVIDATPVIDREMIEAAEELKQSTDDVHLRSTRHVTGYHILAIDGEIGHVKDFIMDDETWQLLFLVVDTQNWFGGKKVLISVKHIKEVQWSNSKVFVNVSIDVIKNSPAINESEYVFPETVHAIHNNPNIHLK
jgi:uncharacterized protein YrrD